MNARAELVRVSWMAWALLPLLTGVANAAKAGCTPSQTNQPMQHDQQVATAPEPTAPEPTALEPTALEPTALEPTALEPTALEPTALEPTALEPTAPFRPHLAKARDLIRARIVSERGEPLGAIEDIVLMADRDGINYVVLSHGGVWGVAEKYFAVPWSHFTCPPGEPGDNGKTFVLKNVSKADLDRAPGFDRSHWPALATESWLEIERGSGKVHAGRAEPGIAPALRISSLRMSKLLGRPVRNLQDENLGRLDNVMIDVHQGKLVYGIVAMRSGFLGLHRDFVAAPWPVLDWASHPGIARLDANRETLTALAFDPSSFPNLEDPQYSQQLYERFRATPYWQTLGYLPSEESKSGELPPSEMTSPNMDKIRSHPGTKSHISHRAPDQSPDYSDRWGGPYGW